MRKKVREQKIDKAVLQQEIKTVESDEVVEELSKEPKLFGVATCDIGLYLTEELNEEDKVDVLGKGEEIEIVGETECAWKTAKGFVSKYFILKKYV